MPPLLCSRKALDSLHEYQNASSLSLLTNVRARSNTKWQQPPSNFFKINFYGATHNDGEKFGIGFVVRNSTGICCLAEASEAVALHWALFEARGQGWNLS